VSPDHGVTLDDEHISWIAGDAENKARLRDIAEVHLQTAIVGENTIASCRIRFADGSTVTIANANKNGLEDDAFAGRYIEFVQDLHERLVRLEGSPIAFTAGLSKGRYQFLKVIVVIAGLFLIVTPVVVLVVTGALSLFFTLVTGVGLFWPLYRVVQANAPRSYDPQAIPEKLIETRSRRSALLSGLQN
jgi:hypothetical protein